LFELARLVRRAVCSVVMRGSAREVVLFNRDRKRTQGVVTEAADALRASVPPLS
jgi:hypothetical protein